MVLGRTPRAAQLEQVVLQAQTEKWRVGATITDNVGQCGRARRILALRWSQIVFVFCFAHDVNNLRCSSASSNRCQNIERIHVKLAAEGTEIDAAFLWKARRTVHTMSNKMELHARLFAPLLRVQSAVQLLFRQHRNDCDFPENLRVFAEAIIAPLSYASYRLQRDQNTVGDVVLSLRDIYKSIKQHLVRHDELLKSVEYRWAQIEQPLFMLGFSLHPDYVSLARELPNTSVSGIGAMCKVAVYYYRRLFNTGVIGDIRRDMLSWMKGRFTRTKSPEFVDCQWEYWEYDMNERPNSLLPRLAMRVLSIAVNTATCERLFSELGMINTAKRNRMSAIKALDFHIIAQHVRQRTQKEASASKNTKKKLLISSMERTSIIDAAALFTPSPGQHIMTSTHEYSDNEGPGYGVYGAETLSLWNEFLDEIFDDEEIDAGYAATQGTASMVEPIGVSERHELSGCDVDSDSDEFEIVPESNRVDFPQDNDRNFPQESIRLPGFRGQTAPLAERFG
ncbi:Hypothetical protein PHPALM_263 [Phytophthora palmivora]|uniref:HAT C-terminal dimerisation domain-containing protein n=1 Tax=Phytophthora palmivora TaxID=4796 RepID=A0A2P4YV96_9STRA|nr:Hypothetical protein PHPALM_263 [Phytophthora palmivora]